MKLLAANARTYALSYAAGSASAKANARERCAAAGSTSSELIRTRALARWTPATSWACAMANISTTAGSVCGHPKEPVLAAASQVAAGCGHVGGEDGFAGPSDTPNARINCSITRLYAAAVRPTRRAICTPRSSWRECRLGQQSGRAYAPSPRGRRSCACSRPQYRLRSRWSRRRRRCRPRRPHLTVTVENVESRSSVNGCGRFRFDADIVTRDWPPGMPHVVKYHWARSGNHAWKMHTMTMDAGGKKHVRAQLNPIEATRGFAWVHVYSPVNFRSAKVGFSNSAC